MKIFSSILELLTPECEVRTLFCVIFGTAIALFSGTIILQFTKDDMELIRVAQMALIGNGISFFTFGFYTVYSSLFLALGKAKEGFLLGACRQGICFVPVILIFTAIGGINGVIYSQPAADILSAIITIFMARKLHKQLKLLR